MDIPQDSLSQIHRPCLFSPLAPPGPIVPLSLLPCSLGGFLLSGCPLEHKCPHALSSVHSPSHLFWLNVSPLAEVHDMPMTSSPARFPRKAFSWASAASLLCLGPRWASSSSKLALAFLSLG